MDKGLYLSYLKLNAPAKTSQDHVSCNTKSGAPEPGLDLTEILNKAKSRLFKILPDNVISKSFRSRKIKKNVKSKRRESRLPKILENEQSESLLAIEPDFNSLQPNARSTLLPAEICQRTISLQYPIELLSNSISDHAQPNTGTDIVQKTLDDSQIKQKTIQDKSRSSLEQFEVHNNSTQRSQSSIYYSVDGSQENSEHELSTSERVEDEDNIFEVEQILGCRVNPSTNIIEYSVSLKGRPGSAIWVSSDQFNCQRLIEVFHKTLLEKTKRLNGVYTSQPSNEHLDASTLHSTCRPILEPDREVHSESEPEAKNSSRSIIELIVISSNSEDEIDGEVYSGVDQFNRRLITNQVDEENNTVLLNQQENVINVDRDQVSNLTTSQSNFSDDHIKTARVRRKKTPKRGKIRVEDGKAKAKTIDLENRALEQYPKAIYFYRMIETEKDKFQRELGLDKTAKLDESQFGLILNRVRLAHNIPHYRRYVREKHFLRRSPSIRVEAQDGRTDWLQESYLLVLPEIHQQLVCDFVTRDQQDNWNKFQYYFDFLFDKFPHYRLSYVGSFIKRDDEYLITDHD